MSLFGRWIMVDWSAASRPVRGPNSIWVADTGPANERGATAVDNPPTRHDAIELLADRLIGSTASAATLIGIDASLSLPREGITALCGSGAGWPELSAVVESAVTDQEDNLNNRFAAAGQLNDRLGNEPGPFWGHPPTQRHRGLSPTRPTFPYGTTRIPEYRRCEQLLRAAGQGVQSTWKIAYAGSVGGQFLTVLGALSRLRDFLGERLVVWPFDSSFGTEPQSGEIWICEVWPGEFPLERAPTSKPVLDADQVFSTVRVLAHADREGSLSAWLRGPSDPADRERAAFEGWSLSPTLAGTRA